jgi:hypothetical protein
VLPLSKSYVCRRSWGWGTLRLRGGSVGSVSIKLLRKGQWLSGKEESSVVVGL